ncbi:glycosyltransferase [Paucihalobacter ruber]|uniref:Glycosyltransferase n=1 Tax=Paucihalobacter ruber TaxID=2567861 RepID=A0A506PPU9_9FLAO|nr:glycosyltransferase family 2 protein [Paucihalobacter ruber]TPV35734.1 glycosyltransferase [Paucihalobacter ruber]
MKISIITATYNSSKTIGSALESVISQTYPNIEHLIVDGASKDDTIEIVKSYQKDHPHIRYISEPDQGIYDALNKGIAMATGDILGFVHADDMLAHPDTIAQIAAAFKANNCDGVYGDLYYVNAQDTTKVIRNWRSKSFKTKLLKRGWMPAHPTLFLKTSLYHTYGVFDTSFRIAADYELVLRIFKHPHLQFHYLPLTIVKMRVGGVSNRSIQNILQKSKEDFRALKRHRLPIPWYTLFMKNLSKIPQFFG